MQIVRILTEKHPSKWCDMARVAAFAWNTSTLQALNYLTPYELMHGQQANLPHAMTKRREEICSEDMLPEDYTTYAKYLNEILEGYYAAFREAKLYTQMKNHIRLNRKLKDTFKAPWLRVGRLVLVFCPTDVTDEKFKRSAKLVFQWKGPLRIKAIHRNAVHFEHLNGTPFSTRSIQHLFPYNREYDELLQAADQYTRHFSIEEQEEITSFKPNDMAIAIHDNSWVLVRITEVMAGGKYYCQAFNTYHEKSRHLGDREYFPVYTRPSRTEDSDSLAAGPAKK
mmetsp:Transcript_4390/g.12980  ORF Transcript_4390/g.12980 Transcript_4390/m.12980 type:complete len:282 (+) Transcript_4390:271-1116(+)